MHVLQPVGQVDQISVLGSYFSLFFYLFPKINGHQNNRSYRTHSSNGPTKLMSDTLGHV